MGSEPAVPAVVPAVVVVVVACDPGDWFEETLGSLAGQDYGNFSVLVMDTGRRGGLAGRVTKVLPEARLMSAPGAGFTEGANEAMATVEGAAHALVCHDDVALAPSALRLLVEEAYRRNGGLTCPKLVLWDAPERLLSVGMGADRLGVAHSLVERGELDQGQQDAAREIFLAPSAAVLVRTDLWRALGGFDLAAGVPGEDLDLSWRAHLAGARVVVAPYAHVRHLEAFEKGMRGAPPGPAWGQRRETNRLRTLWTCYRLWALLWVVPVTVLFAVLEAAWDMAHHTKFGEALVPVKAVGASLRGPRRLWASRRQAQGQRRASDRAVRKLQARGSARLRAVVRRRLEKGHELAWAASRATSAPEQRRPAASDTNWQVTLAAAALVVVILAVGSRSVLGQAFPLVGQMPSTVGGVGGWWHSWWSGGGSGNLGGAGESLPAMFFLGALGLVGGWSANAAVHLLVFGALLLGPLGVYVESKAFGSYRGRLAGTVLYAALPISYNALSQGHLPGLVAYGAVPWILAQLCRLSGQSPYGGGRGRRSWARLLALGLVLAIASCLAPSLLVLVPVLGAALAAGSVLAGSFAGVWRLLSRSIVVPAIAAVALLPWSAHVLGSWRALIGNPAPQTALGVAQLLRFQTGPFGGGALAWAVLVAGAGSLFIARTWRLAWAVRVWTVALVCLFLAWAGARGWFPVPDLELVLAPAGAALAMSTALGGAAVESDLRRYRFGWRQFVPPLGALAVLVAFLPLLGWAGNGQWDLPASGAEASFSFPPASGGDYRVLWAGPENLLPLAAQGRVGSLAFATSADGLPSAAQLWSATGPGAAPVMGRDLAWALDGETTGLGHLLRPLAVRYVVVATPGAGNTPGTAVLAPALHLVEALERQLDFVPVVSGPGYQVFSNTAWAPLFSVSPAPVPSGGAPAQLLREPAHPLQPVVVGPTGQGTVALTASPVGRALYAAVPAGSWSASISGRRLPVEQAFGWASAWRLPVSTSPLKIVISPSGPAGRHALDVVMLLAWGLGLALVVTGLRSRWRAQLALATIELGPPGAEVSEINWGEVIEGENVG